MTIDLTNMKAAASMVAHSLAGQRTHGTVAKATSTQAASTQATSTRAAAAAPTQATAASSGAVISSNDFLSLLVTEMKNQDPTQPTDPNAYIQQLVGVNSLQQLISINQDLTPPTSSTPASPVGAASSAVAVNSL